MMMMMIFQSSCWACPPSVPPYVVLESWTFTTDRIARGAFSGGHSQFIWHRQSGKGVENYFTSYAARTGHIQAQVIIVIFLSYKPM